VLYEIVPVGTDTEVVEDRPSVDPLRYQPAPETRPAVDRTPSVVLAEEWLTVKARYKDPESDTSELISRSLAGDAGSGAHLRLAAALAEFGLLLREDRPASMARWDALVARVRRVEAPEGFSSETREFGELVEIARGLVALH